MLVQDPPTPYLLLERGKVERNAARMRERAARAGIELRPHMKTAKCVQVAELATGGRGPITVSTLAEAAFFAGHGFADITYAVCIVADKLPAVDRIQRGGARVQLLVDSVEACGALAKAAAFTGGSYDVLIEIDSGEHRTGLDPEDADVLDIASILRDARELSLVGVLTHAGHAYGASSIEAAAQIAEDERRAVVGAAERLRAAGHPVARVSTGSTPTAVHAKSFEGLTEIRPGVYTFFDLAQLALGTCSVDDIAISVVATVVSHRQEHGRLIVDAGGLALSKDTSASPMLPDAGYGWICDCDGNRIGDLRVALADQEHGYVEGTSIPFDQLPIGSRVRILPNHACMTAAAHDRYHVLGDGGRIVERWPRVGQWFADPG